jgi:hypothetical protein
MSNFGLAHAKIQGKAIVVDSDYPGRFPEVQRKDSSSYLEIPLTVAQYTHLAFLLESSSELFFRELAADCRAAIKQLEL